MSEGNSRIEVVLGKKPVILVCPHGADDTHTDTLTEECAKLAQCYAVINKGFERADVVVVMNDMADCNRVDHVTSDDVLRDEFLRPITKHATSLRKSLRRSDDRVLILYIHGFGGQVERDAGEKIDVIVGYGPHLNQKRASYTCELWRRDLFAMSWVNDLGSTGEVYFGKAGGQYSARLSNNMCQYYRQHIMDKSIDSMQLEFSYRLRKNKAAARHTASVLSGVIDDLLSHDHYDVMADCPTI